MQIGTIDREKPLLLAPMEDVTDQAFRIVCKRLGADFVFTEFVNSEGLLRNSIKTKKKMEFREEERPFGIQIYGGEESSMEGAARIAESLDPDIIDINCGCCVRNVFGCCVVFQIPRTQFTANQFHPENLHVLGRIDEA